MDVFSSQEQYAAVDIKMLLAGVSREWLRLDWRGYGYGYLLKTWWIVSSPFWTIWWLHCKQAGIRGSVNLTDRAWVVLAGLHIALQQLDHNSLGQVAGGASLSHWRCVVERFHVILGKKNSGNKYCVSFQRANKQSASVIMNVQYENLTLQHHPRKIQSIKSNKALLNRKMGARHI